MKTAQYLDEIVLPTLKDACGDRASRRKAYLACLVVYHVIDYLVVDNAERDVDARGRKRVIEGRLKLQAEAALYVVRAVANGTKHAALEHWHAIPFKPGQDYWRPPARTGEAECGVSQVGDRTGGRQFEDGVSRFDLYREARRLLAAIIGLYPSHFPNCDLGDW